LDSGAERVDLYQERWEPPRDRSRPPIRRQFLRTCIYSAAPWFESGAVRPRRPCSRGAWRGRATVPVPRWAIQASAELLSLKPEESVIGGRSCPTRPCVGWVATATSRAWCSTTTLTLTLTRTRTSLPTDSVSVVRRQHRAGNPGGRPHRQA